LPVQGVYGLPEAVSEIKDLKVAIKFRDDNIEELAAKLTEREKQVRVNGTLMPS
jgi:hypothetical protein